MAGVHPAPYGAWECRRFWRNGNLTKTEWWRGGQLQRRPTHVRAAITTEYCDTHYTRIYRHLPCPYCQEHPNPCPDAGE